VKKCFFTQWIVFLTEMHRCPRATVGWDTW